jgi:hypothetical protein
MFLKSVTKKPRSKEKTGKGERRNRDRRKGGQRNGEKVKKREKVPYRRRRIIFTKYKDKYLLYVVLLLPGRLSTENQGWNFTNSTRNLSS